MGSSIHILITTVMGMIVLSMLLIPPARADSWVGWDDGEFDVGSGAQYVGLQESFSQQMSWSSSPDNTVSMQYNPDEVTSALRQYHADWFQTAIETGPLACPVFTIQVYNTITTGKVWEGDGGTGNCTTGFLADGATWYIREDMVSSTNNHINDVYFSTVSGSTVSSYTLYPPLNWIWLRSNLCWCGVSMGSTTFTSAFGTSTAYSNVALSAIDPPVVPSTAESSNMYYSQFLNQGTTSMLQYFGVGFSLGVDPSTVSIACTYYGCDPGTTVDSALFITSYGYSGSVSLTYTGTGGLSDPYVTGPSSGSVSKGGQTILGVTAHRGGSQGGTFMWTITGTGGGYTFSTTLTIQYAYCRNCLWPVS